MASPQLLILELYRSYLINVLPIFLFELIAALAGTYYLKRKSASSITKFLVYYLWITLFVEIIGTYAPLAYFTEYQYFSFVEDTPFDDNYWLYNIYLIFSFTFYLYYFRSFIATVKWRMFIRILSIIFVLTSILYLFRDGVYFEGWSKYTTLMGTLMLFVSIGLFYFELLRSDIILKLKRFLPIYISIGILIFHLCVTPIDLFSQYFNQDNSIFVKLRAGVLLGGNIFMYSLYTIGFLICSRKTNSSY